MIKDQRIIIFIIGVVIVLISWFFLYPKGKEVYGSFQNLKKEEERLKKIQGKLADLETLNEFELTERANTSLKAIPEEKGVASVMTTLRTVAQETGVSVDSLQVSPGEINASASANTLEKLDFKLEIKGPLLSVLAFFKRMNQSLPLVSFKQVKMEQTGDVSQVKLTLESYSQPLPKTIGKIETSLPKLSSEEEKTLSEILEFYSLPEISFPPSSGRPNPFSF